MDGVGVATIGANRRVFAHVDSPPVSTALRLLWLRPTADLDLATEADATGELAMICTADADFEWIVVHGGPEWFVDVRGSMVLIRGSELARRHDRDLVVVDPPWSLRRIVTVLGMQDQLHLLDSALDVPLLEVPHAR
jgi:anti-anti-sigma regulatory factor